MNVFCDFHHGGLYHSLQLLFEKRLGWKMYRPIGLDWFYQGYWKLAEPYGNAIGTVNQFLSIDQTGVPEELRLNDLVKDGEDGLYEIYDTHHKVVQKAITFNKFKDMDFDIIVSTYAPHDGPYRDLINNYHPKAKLIVQIGNEGQTTDELNVLCSTMCFNPSSNQNFVRYHQEFPLDVFKYETPKTENKKYIRSFVIGLPEADLFSIYAANLPEYCFEAYGASTHGSVGSIQEMAKKISESQFGWHVKPYDGFGHVVHNWFACGRPPIIKGNYYKNKMAEPLLIDKVTCIDVDKHEFSENLNLIRTFSLPENYITMCENAYKRFCEIVNYDSEFDLIKKFLENLR